MNFTQNKRTVVGGVIALVAATIVFTGVHKLLHAEEEFSLISRMTESLFGVPAPLAQTQDVVDPLNMVAAVGATVPSVDVGGRVQLVATTNVYRSPKLSGSYLVSTQPGTALGTVMANFTEKVLSPSSSCLSAASMYYSIITGCTTNYTYRYWKRVNFDTGYDGWVLTSAVTPAVSAAFNGTSEVVDLAASYVRSSPNGTIVATQPRGSIGKVRGNPASSGGYIWWPIDYKSGTDGWVAEQNLANPGVPLSLRAPTNFVLTAPLSSTPNALKVISNTMNVPSTTLSSLDSTLYGQGAVRSVTSPTSVIKVSDLAYAGGAPQDVVMMFGENANGKIVASAIDPATGNTMTINLSQDAANGVINISVIAPDNGKAEVVISMSNDPNSSVVDFAVSRTNASGEIESATYSIEMGVDQFTIEGTLYGPENVSFDPDLLSYGTVLDSILDVPDATDNDVRTGLGTFNSDRTCVDSRCFLVGDLLNVFSPDTANVSGLGTVGISDDLSIIVVGN